MVVEIEASQMFSTRLTLSLYHDYIEKETLLQHLTGAIKGAKIMRERYIFRTWITLKNGEKIYAKDYGKKAFRIPVNDLRNSKKQ